MRHRSLNLAFVIVVVSLGAGAVWAQDVDVGLDVIPGDRYCLGDSSFYSWVACDAPWEGLVLCFPQLQSPDGSWRDLLDVDEEGRARPPLFANFLTNKMSISFPVTDEWLEHFDVDGRVRVTCAFIDVALEPDTFERSPSERDNMARRLVMTSKLDDLLRSAAFRYSGSIQVERCAE